jgi:endoglucanase
MAVEIGKGPAIKVQDSGMIVDPRVKEWMVKRAREARIPYQLEILRGGTTDAQAIQISRDGIPTGALLVPCRYLHSSSEMLALLRKAIEI